MLDEAFLARIAVEHEALEKHRVHAPARLTSRIYSALVRRQAETGPLLSLSKTQAAGRDLCIFERALELAPVSESLKMLNPCAVCHARVLAERLDSPPIFWLHCPYVTFHRR